MQKELNQLRIECERIENFYMVRRNNKKSITASIDNITLAEEFLSKGIRDLNEAANKIFAKLNTDDEDLKSAFQEILKRYITDISKKIISG